MEWRSGISEAIEIIIIFGFRQAECRRRDGNDASRLPGQLEHLTGIDPVRVLDDVGVVAVYLGPEIRIAEVQLALARAVESVTGLKGKVQKERLRTGTVVTTDDPGPGASASFQAPKTSRPPLPARSPRSVPR